MPIMVGGVNLKNIGKTLVNPLLLSLRRFQPGAGLVT